jgi:hypothetical protein
VKPRAALKEWIVVGYSPWSAGRAVFGTQFIEDLMQRPELLNSNNNSSTGGTASSLSAMSGGAQMVEQREKVTQAMKESQQLEAIFSHCRHGKYDDVEVVRSVVLACLRCASRSINIHCSDVCGPEFS